MRSFKSVLALAIVMVFVLSTMGCAASVSAYPAETTAPQAAVSPDEKQTVGQSATSQPTDQELADHVAALIDAIYVQARTEKTDAQCAAAKAAWDALTEAQKELVTGEFADPDYFGRDTGDPSLDDPLNQDSIGENELLVVSFGTSFNTSRTQDIGGIEKALQAAYPSWSVRRAFTAQIIINHIQARDGVAIDNMEQALERAVANGVKRLVIQPTHLMHGAEYDDVTAAVDAYKDRFETVTVAEPLLGEVGSDATIVNTDKEAVAVSITAETVATAGYESLEAAAADGAALVLMGHGTSHKANVTYSQMQTQLRELGYSNVFIGTVEGKPEDTACTAVIQAVHAAGYSKVILRPLMVVAGDHANNDMAGDDADSWKNQMIDSGYFTSVDCQIAGLGSVKDIQAIYVRHAAAAIGEETVPTPAALPDGLYKADFSTDSNMFHVNEANEGKGILTVAGGKMTIHVSLASDGIRNLYCGSAADAQKPGAVILQPTADTITYSDGTTEEVSGFDIPVPGLNEEFALALVGTKGKWYDHRVTVSNPVPLDASANESASGLSASPMNVLISVRQ